MEKDYRGKRVYLKKNEPLSDEVLVAVAMLVRAWAEIEYIVDLYLRNLTGLNDSQALLIVGRQTISSKIALAEKLAALKGRRVYKRHKKAFSVGGDNVARSLKYRNIVAHGQYVGMDTSGKYCFVTKDVIEIKKGRADTEAHAFRPATLDEAAVFSEVFSEALVELLKLNALHQKSQRRFLGPHPKAPKKVRKKGEAPPPREIV